MLGISFHWYHIKLSDCKCGIQTSRWPFRRHYYKAISVRQRTRYTSPWLRTALFFPSCRRRWSHILSMSVIQSLHPLPLDAVLSFSQQSTIYQHTTYSSSFRNLWWPSFQRSLRMADVQTQLPRCSLQGIFCAIFCSLACRVLPDPWLYPRNFVQMKMWPALSSTNLFLHSRFNCLMNFPTF